MFMTAIYILAAASLLLFLASVGLMVLAAFLSPMNSGKKEMNDASPIMFVASMVCLVGIFFLMCLGANHGIL